MAKRKREPGEAGPFLKWAGGKTQLLPELLARVPEQFGTYHEPFVGAGALFFKLRALGRLGKVRLSDVNPELMNAWKALRDEPENVIQELEVLAGRVGKDDFYEIRAWDPGTLTAAGRAARLIYLNKTCFNGLYRENRSGRFNVPFGRHKSPTVLDRDNLKAVSRALQGASVEQAPFGAVLKHARPGDFVYFDPPYHPVSASSRFTTYSKGGFGEEGQRQLAVVFAQLAEQGVHVLLSNSDTPFIRKLFEGKGFEISVVQGARAINSKADRRGPVGELLVRAEGKVRKARRTRKASQLAIDLAS